MNSDDDYDDDDWWIYGAILITVFVISFLMGIIVGHQWSK